MTSYPCVCVCVRAKLQKYANFFQRPHAKLHLQISTFCSDLMKYLKLWDLQIVILNKTSFSAVIPDDGSAHTIHCSCGSTAH